MFLFKKFIKQAPNKVSQIDIDRKLQVQKDYIKTEKEQEYEIVEKEILPEKMICPDCGGITLVGMDFCDKCGGELINQDS